MSARPGEVDPDEAGCRLILFCPAVPDADGIAVALDRALRGGTVAAVILDGEAGDGLLVDLRDVCRRNEVALLVSDGVSRVLAGGADGVHLFSAEPLASVREALGDQHILGASCGLSRHDAMTAGESGADFIAFGAPDRPVDDDLIELIAWWSGLFVLPCLALGATAPDEAARLRAAGADFVGLAAPSWRAPDTLAGFRSAVAPA